MFQPAFSQNKIFLGEGQKIAAGPLMLTVMCVTVANIAAFGYGLDTAPGGGVFIEIHQQRQIVELDISRID